MSVATIGASTDTVWAGAPGEPIAGGVRLLITDESGRPLPAASLTWEAVGENSHVLTPSAQSSTAGYATAGWQLGTNAAEDQQLQILIRTPHHQREITINARAVPHIVSKLRVGVDTPAVLRLGDTLTFPTTAIDPYGNEFPAPDVTPPMFVGGPQRGRTVGTVTSHGVSAALPLHIVQYVAEIAPAADTIELRSLGAELPVGYVVRDDRGRVVADTLVTLAVSDTGVAQVFGSRVRAVQPGITVAQLAIGAVHASVAVAVAQRIASLQFRRDTILFDALRDTTTVYPIARDSLGSGIAHPAVVLRTANEAIVKVTGQTLVSVNPGVTAAVMADSVTGVAASVPVIVEQRITAIDLAPAAFDALGDTGSIHAVAHDKLGSPVVEAGLEYDISDSTVVAVTANGLRSLREGRATLSAWDPVSGTRQTSEVVVAQRVTSVALSAESVRFDALTDTAAIQFTARDRLGAVAQSARVSYSSSDTAVVSVDQDGRTQSHGNGSAVIVASSTDGPADSVAVTVEQRVAGITLERDNLLFESLNAQQRVQAVPIDRLGHAVARARVTYVADDPVVVDVDSLGDVVAKANGAATVLVVSEGDTARVALSVAQRAVRLVVPADTIRFNALGETATLTAVAVDSLGSAVPGNVSNVTVSDPAIADLADSTSVRPLANGVTSATLTAAGVTGRVAIVVDQVATTLSAHVEFPSEVITVPAGEPLPLQCEAKDRNGFVINRDAMLVGSRKGTVSGAGCSTARVERSGYDTLSVEMNGVVAHLPVIVATRPDSVGVLVTANAPPDNPRIQFEGENLANPQILALRPLVEEILAAYGNPTTNLDRARAIRDWVARTAIYPDGQVHPESTTSNSSVLPPGATWRDANGQLSLQRWNDDVAFWGQFRADGYLILDALLGTLDPATGQRADDGMMVHVFGARYQIRDLATYHFLACTFQSFIANTLWAAAGLQSLQVSPLDHDPSAVFIPELGRWVYEDPTYNNEFVLDGSAEPLSPLDLLAVSTAGQTGRLHAVRISGPSFDSTVYNAQRTYLDAGHPEGMMVMGSVLWRRTVGTAGAWNARFVEIDVPAVHNAPVPWGDPTYYVRVTAEQAFPTLAPLFTAIQVVDSVGVVQLASTFPNHEHFERRISNGNWTTVDATDVLPVGACRVEYRSVDRMGNVSANAVVDVWLPRGDSFLASAGTTEARSQARKCA